MEFKRRDDLVFREYSSMVYEELDGANKILTQLLHISRWQDLRLAPLSVNEMCHEVAQLMRVAVTTAIYMMKRNTARRSLFWRWIIFA